MGVAQEIRYSKCVWDKNTERNDSHSKNILLCAILEQKEEIMEQIRHYRYMAFYPSGITGAYIRKNCKTKAAVKARDAYDKAFAVWQDALPGIPEAFAMMEMREKLSAYLESCKLRRPNWIRPMSKM